MKISEDVTTGVVSLESKLTSPRPRAWRTKRDDAVQA